MHSFYSKKKHTVWISKTIYFNKLHLSCSFADAKTCVYRSRKWKRQAKRKKDKISFFIISNNICYHLILYIKFQIVHLRMRFIWHHHVSPEEIVYGVRYLRDSLLADWNVIVSQVNSLLHT